MSASKEKKIRKEQRTAADWVDTKAAKAESEKNTQKKTTFVFLVAAILFVAIGLFSIFFNSGTMQKSTPAVEINGESYSPAQVQYYYINAYQGFVSNYYDYLSYYGLSTSTSLKLQQCYLLEEGTWHDYFVQSAVSAMADTQALYESAQKNGYTWNDEFQAQYDEQMAAMESALANYNQAYSTDMDMKGYLQMVFGSVMTEEAYKAELKRNILASTYANDYKDSLVYSDSEIEAAYEANRLDYDRVNYSLLRISATASTLDADGKAITPTDADKAAALADAKALAQELLEKAQKGETLKDLSSAYQKASLTTGDSGIYYESVFMDWLFDDARKAGDLAILEDESYVYVVQFDDRFRHEYNTVNVRHILLTGGIGSLTSEDAGYEQQQAMLKEMAMAEAEAVLAEWRDTDPTEEGFAKLANEYSQDQGSNTTGGLYEQVYIGQMVDEFSQWCFEEGRQPGDTGVVYSDETGAHVIYFVGFDRPYWEILVRDALTTEDYNAWYEAQTTGYEGVVNNFGMSAVG